jgi:hypothetical protein
MYCWGSRSLSGRASRLVTITSHRGTPRSIKHRLLAKPSADTHSFFPGLEEEQACDLNFLGAKRSSEYRF